MKRFIDSEIFRKKWFMDLPEGFQQLWIYLFCECDPAGVIDYDDRFANLSIRYSIPIEDVLDTFGPERITRLECGKLWLVTFCDFQYPKGVSPTAKVHSKVRESIQKHHLPIPIPNVSNTYSIPKEDLSNRSLDKDKDKDKVEGTEKDTDQDSDPSTIAQRIGKRIADLVPDWSPHLNQTEIYALHDNLPKWTGLTESEWAMLSQWFVDTTERSKYRVRSKQKLIETVDAEIRKAREAGITPSKNQSPAWLPDNWREIAEEVTGQTFGPDTTWRDVDAKYQHEFRTKCRELTTTEKTTA